MSRHDVLQHVSHVFSERYLCLLSPVRLSVVCNVRAPYSGSCNFPQSFYGVWYLGHKFHGNRPREPLRAGELNARGVAKYSDFGPIDGYISETVQDRR